MKKTLPSLRVEEETLEHIRLAIKKYNKKNLFNISLAEFRRLSLEFLSQYILQDRDLPLKLK